MMDATTEGRFWKYVDQSGECWPWTGHTVRGYGKLKIGGRRGTMRFAHRLLWEHLNGEVPEGLELDHLCRNRACVRPDHLESVTHQENMRRARLTHCRRGHLLDGSNLYVNPIGRHVCRTCTEASRRRWEVRHGIVRRPVATDSHCAKGHKWTEETLFVARDGRRTCRICRRERMRQMYLANPEIFKARSRDLAARNKARYGTSHVYPLRRTG